MGRATVYAHLGAGKYSVLYTPEVTAVGARIQALEDMKISLDGELYALYPGRDSAQNAYSVATWQFESALSVWAACAVQFPPCSSAAALMADVQAAGAIRAETGVALTMINRVIADNRARYYAVTQEIAYLNNTKNGSGGGLMEVWCIDYDPNNLIPVNTVVGTVETYGAKGGYGGGYLPRKWVNVQSSQAPAYNVDRDHCVKPVSGIKTAAMFFNWCQWLYVMSRNPQHAVGTVLSKMSPDQTYLDVELFGTTPGASQPGGYPFDGNNSVILLNVPVNYLSCGALAFDAGDKAVVRFTGVNRENPTVIGFAENPFPCISSHVLVRNVYPGLPAAETRYLNEDSCITLFTNHPNPGLVSIGWLDWIDATGSAVLWLRVSGSLGKYRYGKFITKNPNRRDIYRRNGAAITVAADVFGMTEFNGEVFYVTKTLTHFELRDTSESVLASIAVTTIVAVLPGDEPDIYDILDGWFKFSTDGADGVTMLSTGKYLKVSLSLPADVVVASFSIENAPEGISYFEWSIAHTLPYQEDFCTAWYVNQVSGTTRAWALDYVGNSLRFLFVDTGGESLSLPAATSYCAGGDPNDACYWRREERSITRFRLAVASATFDMHSNTGVLASRYQVIGGTNGLDRVPSFDGSGDIAMTDLDIRRAAAAFVGNGYTVTGADTVTVSMDAIFSFSGVAYTVQNVNGNSYSITLAASPTVADGGILIGGAELSTGPCLDNPNQSDTFAATEQLGSLNFGGPIRAELFSYEDDDALFFAMSSTYPVSYHHARYCQGSFSDITVVAGEMPELFGYEC
jgi:hypothetical protein